MTTDLKTRCPHCQTAFRVSSSQLEAARGMVRCGQCLRAFNARQRLFGDDGPGAAPAPAHPPPTPVTRRTARPLTDGDDFYIDDNFDLSRLEGQPASPTESGRDDSDDFYIDDNFDLRKLDALTGGSESTSPEGPSARDPASAATADKARGKPARGHRPRATTPAEAKREATTGEPEAAAPEPLDMSQWRSSSETIIGQVSGEEATEAARRAHWAWYPASLAALLLLALQLLYFNSERIEPDSPLRPAAQILCDRLGCSLATPPPSEIMATRDLVVRTHPAATDALLVDAVLVNRGDQPRPFPYLTLRFDDLQGRPVAQRTFTPDEYLGGEMADRRLIPPAQPVKLELELADPGEEAVSFRLFVTP